MKIIRRKKSPLPSTVSHLEQQRAKTLATCFGFGDDVDGDPVAVACCDCGAEMTVLPSVWEFSNHVARIHKRAGFGLMKSNQRFRCDECGAKWNENYRLALNRREWHKEELFRRVREGTCTEEGKDWLRREGLGNALENVEREREKTLRKERRSVSI